MLISDQDKSDKIEARYAIDALSVLQQNFNAVLDGGANSCWLGKRSDPSISDLARRVS